MSTCGRPLPGSEAQPQPDQRRGPQAAGGLGWQWEGGSSKRWLCHELAPGLFVHGLGNVVDGDPRQRLGPGESGVLARRASGEAAR